MTVSSLNSFWESIYGLKVLRIRKLKFHLIIAFTPYPTPWEWIKIDVEKYIDSVAQESTVNWRVLCVISIRLTYIAPELNHFEIHLMSENNTNAIFCAHPIHIYLFPSSKIGWPSVGGDYPFKAIISLQSPWPTQSVHAVLSFSSNRQLGFPWPAQSGVACHPRAGKGGPQQPDQ